MSLTISRKKNSNKYQLNASINPRFVPKVQACLDRWDEIPATRWVPGGHLLAQAIIELTRRLEGLEERPANEILDAIERTLKGEDDD